MFGSIGIPELLIVLVVSGFWLIPVAVAVWVVLTLSRLRNDQQAIRASLESIERTLRA
jgi:type IV secretory pathway VirB3-like protein